MCRSIDKCNKFHTHSSSGGSIDLYLKLHTNLKDSTRVIVYSSYSSYLTFDKKCLCSIFLNIALHNVKVYKIFHFLSFNH